LISETGDKKKGFFALQDYYKLKKTNLIKTGFKFRFKTIIKNG